MSTEQLTSTSYLVLGLLAREGPSTPYELKRHVAATLGHFWSFPHTLLYGEPARLAGLGLLTERREPDGRRRRVFTITKAGRVALLEWLSRPSHQPTELRDPGLLQLFLADLGPPAVRLTIAATQLAIHRSKLAEYEAQRVEPGGSRDATRGQRTAERWHGETVRMGQLYERAAVHFWSGVAADAGPADAPVVQARAEDDGTAITS